jgi:CRISPR-associated exonuclease Cas4
MLDDTSTFPIRVSDLKQWAYCPRVWYYHHCLPDVRPITYKMQHGAEAGLHTEELEQRRSLRVYGLTRGQRTFNVALTLARLGLRGSADMVIDTDERGERELIPVDFKESKLAGDHVKLQVAAYGVMLEEMLSIPVRRGFLYLIPLRQAEEIVIDKRLRKKVEAALLGMQQVVLRETMPPPTSQLSKCAVCEFRRFCNDVM